MGLLGGRDEVWAEGAEEELEEEGYDGAICASCCLGSGGGELGIRGGVFVVAHVNKRSWEGAKSWGAGELLDYWRRPLEMLRNVI